MSFVPDLQTLALYTVACLILCVTPGPDMSLWLAKTVSGGRRGGIAAMLGTQVGCLFHTIFAAVGLSAILAASATAFAALKIVGALYLAWLAVNAIRSGSALNVKAEKGDELRVWPTFLVGLGINVSNPKVVLFFLTFLPQFVAAHDPEAAAKMIFLGLFFIAINIVFSIVLILGAERLIGWLKGRRSVLRAIDYTFAGVFGFFAVRILTLQGR
jgi:threonine/homoserine/homoserine lactone efflux protein